MSHTQAYILSVNGGEIESVLGLFATKGGVDAKIAAERDGGGFSRDEGYTTTDRIASTEEANVEYVFVHHTNQDWYEWELRFTIQLEVIQG